MRQRTGVRRPRLEHMTCLSWFEAFAGAARSGVILNLAEGMVCLALDEATATNRQIQFSLTVFW